MGAKTSCLPVFSEWADRTGSRGRGSEESPLEQCAQAIIDLLEHRGVEGVKTAIVSPSESGPGPDAPLIVMHASEIERVLEALDSLKGPLKIDGAEQIKREPLPGMREHSRDGHMVLEMITADPEDGQVVVKCGKEILKAIARKIRDALPEAQRDGAHKPQPA